MPRLTAEDELLLLALPGPTEPPAEVDQLLKGLMGGFAHRWPGIVAAGWAEVSGGKARRAEAGDKAISARTSARAKAGAARANARREAQAPLLSWAGLICPVTPEEAQKRIEKTNTAYEDGPGTDAWEERQRQKVKDYRDQCAARWPAAVMERLDRQADGYRGNSSLLVDYWGNLARGADRLLDRLRSIADLELLTFLRDQGVNLLDEMKLQPEGTRRKFCGCPRKGMNGQCPVDEAEMLRAARIAEPMIEDLEYLRSIRWEPTHRLAFHAATWEVMLRGQEAWTSDEWAGYIDPAWRCIDGAWLHLGRPTPFGAPGAVTVEAIR